MSAKDRLAAKLGADQPPGRRGWYGAAGAADYAAGAGPAAGHGDVGRLPRFGRTPGAATPVTPARGGPAGAGRAAEMQRRERPRRAAAGMAARRREWPRRPGPAAPQG